MAVEVVPVMGGVVALKGLGLVWWGFLCWQMRASDSLIFSLMLQHELEQLLLSSTSSLVAYSLGSWLLPRLQYYWHNILGYQT